MNIRLKPETRHLLRMVWTLLGTGSQAYIIGVLADSYRLPNGVAHYRLFARYITAIEARRRSSGMRDIATIRFRNPPGFGRESPAAAYVLVQARRLASATLDCEIRKGTAELLLGVNALNTRLWLLADGAVREEVL